MAQKIKTYFGNHFHQNYTHTTHMHPHTITSFPTPQPASRGQSPNIPVALPPHDTAQSLDQELAKQVWETGLTSQSNLYVWMRQDLDTVLKKIVCVLKCA